MGLTPKQDHEITRLYYEMHQMLFSYANNALKDRSLAEEAVQDTFRIACSKPDVLLTSPNPKGWLTITLKYVIENIRRSRARWTKFAARLITMAEANTDLIFTLPDEESIALEAICTKVLDAEEFRLLKRVVQDKLTMAEAAQEFNINVEACKKRIQRAKMKLKNYLQKNS